MNVRYTGPDAGQLVSLPDGDTVAVDRLEWLDTTAEHARNLARRDDWELEAVVKAKRTKKKAAQADPVPEEEPAPADPDPAEPVIEENI